MTIYYSSLLQIDKDANHEIENLQLESNGDLYPFSNIVYYANYSNIWRIINAEKKIIDTLKCPICC